MINRLPPKAKELKDLHRELESGIGERLAEFERTWASGSEEDVFFEAAFCLFTPQSSSHGCFEAVTRLRDKGLLYSCGDPLRLQAEMKGVRFHITKSKRLIQLREFFSAGGGLDVRGKFPAGGVRERRDWLVRSVKGYGYKEASHLLRNLGFGESAAILDRHILRAMVEFGLIDELPGSLNRDRYLSLESVLKDFSSSLEIPFAHLDFVLWYRVNGDIFR